MQNMKLNECDICGKRFIKINVHHINRNPNDNRNENLIKVCGRCHFFIHRGIKTKIRKLMSVDILQKIYFYQEQLPKNKTRKDFLK